MQKLSPRIAASITVLTFVLAHLAVAGTNEPIAVPPRKVLTNASPTYFTVRAMAPSAPAAGSVLPSPAEVTNFLAMLSRPYFDLVPDTHGAVGTNVVMGIFNNGVTFHTRSGAFIRTNTLDDFWASTNIALHGRVFDPRVVYDPYHHRWIAVSVTERQSTNARVLIGVSLTSNPTNGWNLRETKADPNNLRWADYPTIGFNKDWIVVQANMGPNDTNVVGIHSHIYVFNKTNLYGGGFTPPTMFAQTNSETAGSEVPTITYDTNLSTVYLLQSANSSTNAAGYLRLFSITGALGAEVLNYQTNPVYIRVNEPWANAYTNSAFFPPPGWDNNVAPQSNTTELIGGVVDSRLSNVIYRNGSLWMAQTIFLPTNNLARRSSIQWWQIKPDTAEVLQRGRIDDPAGINFYAFGSIAVNRFNDVLIGYSSFSTNQYASANYSFRAFYDPHGQLRSPRIYWAGEGIFVGLTRWGDYSATVVDPVNDIDMWTIQEYAGPYVGVDSRADTRWAHVALPVPANDVFSAAVSISGAQGSTNGTTIRATRESGEPNHSGHANTPSVWHSWTAPSSGNVEFALTNAMVSGFDTSLAVYTGSSVGNLTSVTNRYGVAPKVTFSATSGVTYRIAISGYGGSSGDYTLFWLQPTAPYFTEHPQTTNTVVGENVTLSSVAIGYRARLISGGRKERTWLARRARAWR